MDSCLLLSHIYCLCCFYFFSFGVVSGKREFVWFLVPGKFCVNFDIKLAESLVVSSKKKVGRYKPETAD